MRANGLAGRVQTSEHDSVLGRWSFSVCRPTPELLPYVEALWAASGSTTYSHQRILPRGGVEVLFNLGAPHHLVRGDEARVEFRRAWVAGLQETSLLVNSPMRSSTMGIRFRAAGGFALLGIPMAELTSAVVDLDDLLGSGPLRVQERLQATPSVEARFEILEQFVLDRVRRAKAPSAHVAAAVGAIGRTRGTTRMADLTRDLGVSDTRLVQVFKKEIGLTPKRFARVVRLQAVLDHLQAATRVPWAALAQDFGFFDQAHFVRDFRDLTGASPTEFLRTRAPDGQAIVVDGQ